jgi:hypothetical protein
MAAESGDSEVFLRRFENTRRRLAERRVQLRQSHYTLGVPRMTELGGSAVNVSSHHRA